MRKITLLLFIFICINDVGAQIVTSGLGSAKTMALIPKGAFTMGSNLGPDDEKPSHTLFIESFFLDILPVTNAEFAEFLNSQGLKNKRSESFYDDQDNDARIHLQNLKWQADNGYAMHPVNEVSWVGARDYCIWLNKRLPTEAEWEKAARGTDQRKYPWGNSKPNNKQALFGASYNASAPVDAFPEGASPYGILDMAGNQWEWVSSAYQAYPYKSDDGRENQNSGPIPVSYTHLTLPTKLL
jgi:formylglycine-generating enzyme required for sulfatase activity